MSTPTTLSRMQAYFKNPYDAYYSVACYMLYEEGDKEVLNDLIISLMPLVRIVFKKEVGVNDGNNQSQIEGEALEEVFRIVSDKNLPYSPRSFTHYLYKVIKHSMSDTLSEWRGTQVFDYWKVCRSPHAPVRTPDSIVDPIIYENQITKLIISQVSERIRFIGVERLACLYVVRCLLASKNVDPTIARRKYDLTMKRAKHLIRCMRVLIKSCTMGIYDDERDGSATLSSIGSAS